MAQYNSNYTGQQIDAAVEKANTAIQTITAAAGSNIGSVGTPSVTASTSNNATTLTFNYLKGAKGDKGDTGSNGSNGTNGTSAYWFSGTAVTGTATSGISATVSGSKAGDMYLNTSTYNVYKATAANTWGYICNIKGAGGSSGTTPSITASATVDNNTGTPSVNVTKSGTDAAPTFAFAFTNIKGAKGDPGQNATTTNIFSATANGLAPMASSGNKTTAETAVGKYYLCADGKYRQLPENAFKDTTYSSEAAAQGGTAVSLCTTGEKYTWNNKLSASSFTNNNKGTSVEKIMVADASNGLGYSTPSDLASVLGVRFIPGVNPTTFSLKGNYGLLFVVNTWNGALSILTLRKVPDGTGSTTGRVYDYSYADSQHAYLPIIQPHGNGSFTIKSDYNFCFLIEI